MNTLLQGDATELKCALAFIECGYEISFPYGAHSRYDFIADVQGKLYKIQVKTCKVTEDYLEFECRSSQCKSDGHHAHQTYSEDEIDFFATYYNNKCYLVPVNECSVKKRLRFSLPKNGQTTGINFAKDYEMEEVLK